MATSATLGFENVLLSAATSVLEGMSSFMASIFFGPPSPPHSTLSGTRSERTGILPVLAAFRAGRSSIALAPDFRVRDLCRLRKKKYVQAKAMLIMSRCDAPRCARLTGAVTGTPVQGCKCSKNSQRILRLSACRFASVSLQSPRLSLAQALKIDSLRHWRRSWLNSIYEALLADAGISILDDREHSSQPATPVWCLRSVENDFTTSEASLRR